jgi:uncharacterized protein YjbI with pentapeptide repeats
MKKGWVITIIVLAVLLIAGIIFMIITEWGPVWVGVAGHSEPQMFDNQEYVPRKTLWDLLELLIVPGALALTALWFSNRERKDDREATEKRAQIDREVAENRAQTDRDISTDRLQEAALHAYYDKMTELLLEKKLREAEKGEEVISIARSRTLTTLRSLDGKRKGMLIKFLCEANLINRQHTLINLDDADLDNAELSNAIMIHKNFMGARMKNAALRNSRLISSKLAKADLNNACLILAQLSGTDLKGAYMMMADLRMAYLMKADLRGARLEGANLSQAVLIEADLSEAQFDEANLIQADLKYANLHEADLRYAKMIRADLTGADLSKAFLRGALLRIANLTGAELSEADLSGADLSEAKLNQTKGLLNEQLATVKTLHGAIMMDGETYDPAIHTEIAKLRKEAGLDDGNTPPEESELLDAFKEQGDRLVEDAAEEAGEGGGEAGG